jgi:hypothetical protein
MVSCLRSSRLEGNRNGLDSSCKPRTRKLALYRTRTWEVVSGFLESKAVEVLLNRTCPL